MSLIGDLAGLDVLDVGAGTGKFTRFLARDSALDVSVIEPDDEMRKVLVRQSPEVTVLIGRAESVPADDASFDAVFSSSAWHWFRQPDADERIRPRAARRRRALCLWNGFSRDVPWMAELTELRERAGRREARRPRGWTRRA